MIGFYKDAALQIRVLPSTPKRFMLPLQGGSRTGTLYLGDPYTATITEDALSGDSTLALDQTFEFPSAGSAVICIPAASGVPASQMVISYTGITGGVLTGVTGLTAAVSHGCFIRPNIVWRTTGNIVLYTSGEDVPANVQAAFGLPASSSDSNRVTRYGVSGGAFITPVSSINSGTEHALRVDVKVSTPAGIQAEFVKWQLITNTFYSYQSGDSTAIPAGSFGIAATAAGDMIRQDQALPAITRVLPINRQVTESTPGFVVGQYRWRDKDQVNSTALVPAKWDQDVSSIGVEKFLSGIGCNDDLKPLSLVEQDNSVFLTIEDGDYFDGTVRYFLPGTARLEFHPAKGINHLIQDVAAAGKPVFVGRWKVDSAGFYSIAVDYRRRQAFSNNDSYEYQLNRTAKTLTLSKTLPSEVLLVGLLSGSGSDKFLMPVHPIWSVDELYIPLAGDTGRALFEQFDFNQDEGTLTVTYTPGGLYAAGQPLVAKCSPAIAIEYEPASGSTTRQLPVDLNPAFSGVTRGFVYLQHRKVAPVSIDLASDKPLIDIPATYQSIIDLVAYGPVYFNGDFSLLSAKAYGPLGGELVPNVTMRVLTDPDTWSGQINYQDPTAGDVTVTTGADGIVNMIYTPKSNWGITVPNAASSGTFGGPGFLAGLKQTTIANDTLVLPEAVPISQIWDGTKWLVTFYSVLDNNPIYGSTTADTSKGQIPWTTSGTPGLPGYKTNGQLVAWGGSQAVRPLHALDVNGNNETAPAFTGQVVALVYAQAVPTSSATAVYFVTPLQRVTIQLQVIGSNVKSNLVLLQMADPALIVNNPWLRLNDAVQGYLGQYRLGAQK